MRTPVTLKPPFLRPRRRALVRFAWRDRLRQQVAERLALALDDALDELDDRDLVRSARAALRAALCDELQRAVLQELVDHAGIDVRLLADGGRVAELLGDVS